MESVKIAVLVSGSGSNLQTLIDKQKEYFNGEIVLVVSNVADCFALQRAKDNNIDTRFLSKKDFPNPQEFDSQLLKLLEEYKIDLIVLAGYLKIMTEIVIDRYENKIINIHPSLLPSFGGKGYYGIKVHEAVINQGCKVSGATVHFVDKGTDTGPIILQESLNIDQDWDAEQLQKEVLNIEHKLLPKAVKLFCENKLVIEGKRVFIR